MNIVEIENRASERLKQNRFNFSIFNTAFIILLIVLFATAYYRNTIWRKGLTLWEDVVEKSPKKSRGYNNLGTIYSNKGMMGEAIKEYLTALKIDPNNADVHYNLGIAYHEQGKLDEAVQEYKTALIINPGGSDAHNNLGITYQAQGRLNKAMQEYQTAL